MEEIITIDRAGRLVIPVRLRRRHGLTDGARIRLVEEGDRLVLEPLGQECPTEEINGLLVITARLSDDGIDHRTVRQERLDALAPRR